MKTTEWLKHYQKICSTLNIDHEKDLLAAHILSNLILGRSLSRADLAPLFREKRLAAVFGAGPSLEEDLELFTKTLDSSEIVTIAVDGAAAAFQKKGLSADVVVTDLDGGDDVLLKASEKGALLVVHAHGDNIERLKQLVPKFSGKILGTTQTEIVGVLDNFGGFTDGDRAVYMCEELGAKHIAVAGMDFDGEIGEYSKPKALSEAEKNRKKQKLQIGKELLETLAKTSHAHLYDVSQTSSTIKGFRKTTWRKLAAELREKPLHRSECL